MRSLSSDYAALLSSCPGVRHQTVIIDIHYSQGFMQDQIIASHMFWFASHMFWWTR